MHHFKNSTSHYLKLHCKVESKSRAFALIMMSRNLAQESLLSFDDEKRGSDTKNTWHTEKMTLFGLERLKGRRFREENEINLILLAYTRLERWDQNDEKVEEDTILKDNFKEGKWKMRQTLGMMIKIPNSPWLPLSCSHPCLWCPSSELKRVISFLPQNLFASKERERERDNKRLIYRQQHSKKAI